jgi:hypothetical protein
LQCLTFGFVRHFLGGQPTEFIVNERQDFSRSRIVSLRGRIQQAREVAHGRRAYWFQWGRAGEFVLFYLSTTVGLIRMGLNRVLGTTFARGDARLNFVEHSARIPSPLNGEMVAEGRMRGGHAHDLGLSIYAE